MPDLFLAPWASLLQESLPPLVINAAVASVLVLTAAAAATSLMSRASAAARHLVWCVAVASLILLPVLSAVLPRWDGRPMPAPLPPLAATPAVGAPTLGDGLAPGRAFAEAPSAPPSVWRLRTYLAFIWGAGAVLLLIPTVAGRAALRRLEEACTPLHDEVWSDALDHACAELRIRRRRVSLLVGDQVTVPLTWGMWRPRVLLPANCVSWSAERRRVVLLHELGHVQRWDCLTQLMAQVVRALYWFNPLAWLPVWRMQVERERACDDAVLRLGTPASNYATHLVSLAAALRVPALPWPAAAAMARSSQVGQRVREILEERRSRRPVTRGHVIAAAVLLAIVTVPMACMKSGDAGASRARASAGVAGSAERTSDGWTVEQIHAAKDLRRIAAAAFVYSEEYRGRMPLVLGSTWDYLDAGSEYVPAARRKPAKPLPPAERARVYLSPQDERHVVVPNEPTPDWVDGQIPVLTQAGYVYLGSGTPRWLGQPYEATVLLMHTDLAAPFRDAQGRETAVAVFFDGHAEVLPVTEVRRLSEAMKNDIERRDAARKKAAATQPAQP